MTDIIEAIRQREIEHQRDHDKHHTESCLPAGCSRDEGDIPVLLREVDRLTALLPPVNAAGHVDCPACGTSSRITEEPGYDGSGEPMDLTMRRIENGDSHAFDRAELRETIGVVRAGDAVVTLGDSRHNADGRPILYPGETINDLPIGDLQWMIDHEWTEAKIRELAAEEGIDLTGCIIGGAYASGGINRAQMIERLRMLVVIPLDDPDGYPNQADALVLQPKRSAGRPRNCRATKGCKGKLRTPAEKEAGACRKCRKAQKAANG